MTEANSIERIRVYGEEIDADHLLVEKGIQIPKSRKGKTSKYDDVFSTMRPGDSIRCESSETAAVSNALRKSIQNQFLPNLVGCSVVQRQKVRGKNGEIHGRVWAVPSEEK